MALKDLIFIFIIISSSRSYCKNSYISVEQMPTLLRFGSEMTISSDELLASYPKNGNVVQVTNKTATEFVEKIRASIVAKYKRHSGNSRKFR